MREVYQSQLEQLHVELVQMGALCEHAISSAEKSMLANNEKLTEEVHQLEHEIDQKDRDIEDLCMKMIMRQQPVASDLRLISAALRMISDLERIGDQACDITDITKELSDTSLIASMPIRDMAEATERMLTDSVDSFVRSDLELAKKVMEADDYVDGKFLQIREELVNLLREKPEKSEGALDFLMIAKYYERIGDHAVNIAEWVEYSITGEHAGDGNE